MHAKPEPESTPEWREVSLALGLLFGGTLVLAALSMVLPAISGWLQALLALMLLTVPSLVLRGRGIVIDDLGVDLGPPRRTLTVAFVVMFCVTPLYLGGFHLVHGVLLERSSDWSVERLARWDDDLRDTPARPCEVSDHAALAWTTGDALWIMPPRGKALTLSSEGGGGLSAKLARCDAQGRLRAQRSVEASAGGLWVTPTGVGLRVPLEGLSAFSAEIQVDGEPSPLEVGAFRQSRDDDGRLTISRTPWWILTFLVVHLGLVALPEEWFFRGYLQTRLDQRWGTPWRLLGVSIGPSLIWSSLAFALLHPILIPGAHRLLVFFPALLFGWLRARTGNIGAAVVVHAACNLLQALTAGMYL